MKRLEHNKKNYFKYMKKIILLTLIVGFVFPLGMQATNSGITVGPYLQRVSKKAATVLVRTDTDQKLILKYKKESAKKWKTKTDVTASSTHRYRLLRLKKKNNYKYYLTDSSGNRLTQTYTFETRSKIKKNNPLKVAVLGDSRTGDEARLSVAQQIMRWDPEMILHSGDFGDTGTETEFIDDVFTPYQALLAERVMYGAIGNHDFTTAEAAPYKEFFELPQKNSGSENYYSFTVDKAHFITINTSMKYIEGSDQYIWLDQELAASNKKWKIVFMHHPPYSSGSHGSTEAMWDTIVPLFEAYGVDLVFTGHDHCYERNQEINGVRYIVSAGGGAPLYDQVNDATYSEKFLSDYHFVGMVIYPKKIKIKAIDDQGYVFDRLTIK